MCISTYKNCEGLTTIVVILAMDLQKHSGMVLGRTHNIGMLCHVKELI